MRQRLILRTYTRENPTAPGATIKPSASRADTPAMTLTNGLARRLVVRILSDPPEKTMPEADRHVADEQIQYQVIGSRRQQFDNLLWQVPILSLTGQAFLFTIALTAGNSEFARRRGLAGPLRGEARPGSHARSPVGRAPQARTRRGLVLEDPWVRDLDVGLRRLRDGGRCHVCGRHRPCDHVPLNGKDVAVGRRRARPGRRGHGTLGVYGRSACRFSIIP
jgi:hypothetical protein